MTHEEEVVRAAYAKLSYAVDIKTAFRAVQSNRAISPADLARQVELKRLRFQLSDFKVGNLTDVGDTKYVDFAGQFPDGQDIVNTTIATETLTEEGSPTASTDSAVAEWGRGPSGIPPFLTMRESLHLIEEESGVKPLLRYCTYTVKVTLEGRSRTYKTSFLFGSDGQVAPGDAVVGLGGGALAYFITHPIVPDVFLKTSLAASPAVRSFLAKTGGGE
jgi:hypothetical protein